MKEHEATITVLGAGYVGLTTAAILSNSNFKVYVVEPNPDRLAAVKQGRSFFFEEGLDPLVAKGVSSKSLIPTDSYEQSVPESDFIFSCVGTPDNPDGSSNLTYVFSAAEMSMSLAKPDAIYVQKSTVPVGTGERIEKLMAAAGRTLSYVSNPEFLREGTALSDSLYFDRIVAGGRDKEAVRKVTRLYKKMEEHRDEIAKLAKIKPEKSANNSYIETSLNSAELIKVTSNAFLALKISFANSIAKLADQAGADVNEVMDAVGADPRIGRAFLNAGRGYGGGCFPKDVSGLISSATEHGVDLPIMVAATEVNESMPGYIVNKAQNELGQLEGQRVAVLGLAFKTGTSDVRRSPGVALANTLSHSGSAVTVYDPEANGEAKEDLRKSVAICNSLEEAVKNADAVIVATAWPEFLDYDLKKLAAAMKGDLFVDAMNAFDTQTVEQAGLRYIGVGRGSV